TWAAYCWAFLKVDYTVSPIHWPADSPTHSSKTESPRNEQLAVTPAHRFSESISITPKAPVLIIEPGDLHKQFIDEGQRIFKTNVTALDSQDTFLRLSKLDPTTGRRSLPPGFYITSYTQLGSNGVGDFPDPLKAHPKVLLQFLGLTVESVRAEFERGSIAADPKGYYKLLGVPRCATPAELCRAYRLLSKRYHPDVSTEPDGEEMMKRINDAFKILSDSETRKDYDRSCSPAKSRTFRSACASKGTEVVKVNRTWDDLSDSEQLEIIREFCVEKLRHYGLNIGQWGHRLDEREPRFPARCVLSPTLADLCQDCFHAVIVDEGTRMKGGETTLIGTGVLQMNALHRLVLTATPIKNRTPDVFWLAWWACGGHLEAHARWPYAITDKDDFAATFCVTERNLTKEAKERGTGRRQRFVKLTPQVCNIHRIWKLMAPIILRRRKKDVGEQIVKKHRHVYRTPLGTAQARLYKQYLDWKPVDKNGLPAVGKQLQMLRMVAAAPHSPLLPLGRGPAYIPKVAAALTLIEQVLRRGEQVIVFSPFHDPLDTVSARLQDAGVKHFVLDGRTSQTQRGRMAAVFKRGPAGGVPVMLAGIECMAEGHSFQLCNNEIMLSYPWALDKVVQAEDRSHRLNSAKDLSVYRIISEGSVDRKMESQIDEKADAAELVLDGHLLGEMTSEVNLAELLDIAAKEFDKINNTIDEAALESEWLVLRRRLREAFESWQKVTEANESEMIKRPASEARSVVTSRLIQSDVVEETITRAILLPTPPWRQRWLKRKFAA
ncbi:MAG: DnaJ domain-containing protein, partial [Verrucomicrobia bacterium]|nr:DnaJ domain-containing protein [Verrucomicrobiota bacterium]